jgi:Mannosylglycerate hydrolase MGH1-like glycoside hydrolase domain
MSCEPNSPYLQQLRNRIGLQQVPFSDRGSRLLVFRDQSRLRIALAERWIQSEAAVGPHPEERPIVDDFTITDEHGTPVNLSVTAFPHALCIETALGSFALAFMDEETLYLQLPEARFGISFRVYAMQGSVDRRGGEFKGDPHHRNTHRNVAYSTDARILSNTIQDGGNGYLRVQLSVEAGANRGLVLNITPRLGFNRSMPPGRQVLEKAEARWHAWFAAVPPVEDKYAAQYYYAWWILRAGLLSPRYFLTREAMIPSMISYIGVWQWDAFFHALAYQYVDQRLAENQLRVLLDHQSPDGMIPDAVYDEGAVTTLALPHSTQIVEVTKPPLLAWAALKLYALSGNRDFLDEIYEPTVRWSEWWFQKNDDDQDGIVQYTHPNSSGLDDSPLWDQGMPVESPDLNTYLVIQMDTLGQIAQILGLPEEARKWRERAEALTTRMIEHFWDERAGVFWATYQHQPIPVLTPFNLYPLLTGRLSPAMTARLVDHLLSPEEFWTTWPLPTVACSDPTYDPYQMWRGPTWVNINYLFIEGLLKAGFSDLARQLRDKTLELLMRHNDIYEYYNPETGERPPKAASVFGWSSAVFVDLAIKASRGQII